MNKILSYMRQKEELGYSVICQDGLLVHFPNNSPYSLK